MDRLVVLSWRGIGNKYLLLHSWNNNLMGAPKYSRNHDSERGMWMMVQDDNYMFVVPLPPKQPLRSDRSRGGGRDWMDGGGSFEYARIGDTTRNLSKN